MRIFAVDPISFGNYLDPRLVLDSALKRAAEVVQVQLAHQAQEGHQ